MDKWSNLLLLFLFNVKNLLFYVVYEFCLLFNKTTTRTEMKPINAFALRFFFSLWLELLRKHAIFSVQVAISYMRVGWGVFFFVFFFLIERVKSVWAGSVYTLKIMYLSLCINSCLISGIVVMKYIDETTVLQFSSKHRFLKLVERNVFLLFI